jgi:hypothetical protein
VLKFADSTDKPVDKARAWRCDHRACVEKKLTDPVFIL